jgi:hypothetical protein
MFDVVWTRKRQAGVAGKSLAERLSDITAERGRVRIRHVELAQP